MGYSNTGGPKGLGVFNNTPQTTADFNKALELMARVGNFRVESTSTRDAISGDALYEGLTIWNTTTKAVEVYDGAGWVRVLRRKTSFTPTWGGLTLGSATVSAWYQISGNICQGFVTLALGSGSAITGNLTMNLPVAAANASDGIPIGEGVYTDFGSGYYAGQLIMNGSGQARVAWQSGSFYSDVNASQPFGWTTSDSIRLQFRYEVAG